MVVRACYQNDRHVMSSRILGTECLGGHVDTVTHRDNCNSVAHLHGEGRLDLHFPDNTTLPL